MTQLGQILLGGLGLYIHSKTLVERAVTEASTGNDVSMPENEVATS